MKKNGFTLAEVLITLTIIGVIATMTLPALITNTQEQQAKTAFKKGISTLTDVAQMNVAIEGYDYASLTSDSFGNADVEERSLFSMFANRGNIDIAKSFTGEIANKDASVTALGAAGGGTVNSVIYFRDGSAVLYDNTVTTVGGEGSTVGTLLGDKLASGFTVIFDTNGSKGPNILSNCEGNAAGAIDTKVDPIYGVDDDKEVGEEEDTDYTNACVGNHTADRVIKDQFLVRLRGGNAVPYGAAAHWAYNN